jgi:hypothetical protein
VGAKSNASKPELFCNIVAAFSFVKPKQSINTPQMGSRFQDLNRDERFDTIPP